MLYQLLAISLIVLTGHPTAVSAQTNTPNPSQHLGQELDSAIQRTSQGGYWGAALIVRGGEVLLDKGYGFADYQDTPNTPATLFEIASLSKQFTAAGIYRLQMDGLLSVDDPVSKFFPQFIGEKAPITIYQLLTHTSGISSSLGLPYASDATRDELIEMVANEPLVSTPGEVLAYCNAGYAVLAALIEVVSEQPFEEYLRDHIFQPAGLEHTGFIGDEALLKFPVSSRLSQQSNDLTAVQWHWGWGYRGMGGVVTSTQDLLRWHQALNTNRVLDEGAQERMFAPNLDGYASGWMLSQTSSGYTTIGHGGRVQGYGCVLVRVPEEDTLIVLLSNDHANIWALQQAIDEVLFPKPTVRISMDVTGYELNEYRAAIQTDRWIWRVALQDDRIALILTNRPDDAVIAQIDMPRQAAAKLAADLRRTIEQRSADSKPEESTEVGVYLYAYEGKRSVAIEDVELRVMPRYSGQDRDGNRIIDNRITFIAVDAARGFWPVMSKLSDQAAADLLLGLENAITE